MLPSSTPSPTWFCEMADKELVVTVVEGVVVMVGGVALDSTASSKWQNCVCKKLFHECLWKRSCEGEGGRGG